MKRLLKIGILLVIAGILFNLSNIKSVFFPSTVRAFGDFMVDFHVPKGTPIFNVINMIPGDSHSHNIDVTNGGSKPQAVFTKGVRTGGIGKDPKLETSLYISIVSGGFSVYGSGSPTGSKTLLDFFNDSNITSGIPLGLLGQSQHKTYNLTVLFPRSAGNEYQAKSVIFDLTFGAENTVPSGPPKNISECKKGGWKLFTIPKFKNQWQCEYYVEKHNHKITCDIKYSGHGLKDQTDGSLQTGDGVGDTPGQGSFSYMDSNKNSYQVLVSAVNVFDNTGYFAGQITQSNNKLWVGLWLFGKVVDNGKSGSQIWSSLTDKTSALDGVNDMVNPTDGPFTVSGNLQVQ
jgi:hypothetical protein